MIESIIFGVRVPPIGAVGSGVAGSGVALEVGGIIPPPVAGVGEDKPHINLFVESIAGFVGIQNAILFAWITLFKIV